MALKVQRAAAVTMMQGLGFDTAKNWNNKRLTAKLTKLPEVLGPNDKAPDEDSEKLLTAILAELESGGELVVEPNGEAEAEAEAATETQAAEAAPEAAAPAPATEAAPAAEEPAEEAAPATEKPSKPQPSALTPKPDDKPAAEKPKAPKKPKQPRVTRNECAGLILGRTAQLEAHTCKITPEMIEAVNKEYGRANDVESDWRMRYGQQALTGFFKALEEQGYELKLAKKK